LLGKKVRMSAPASLDYPLQVSVVAVSAGGYVEKGGLLVRLIDKNGKLKSIKAPYDCTVSRLLTSENAILDAPAPLLEFKEGKVEPEEEIEPDLIDISSPVEPSSNTIAEDIQQDADTSAEATVGTGEKTVAAPASPPPTSRGAGETGDLHEDEGTPLPHTGSVATDTTAADGETSSNTSSRFDSYYGKDKGSRESRIATDNDQIGKRLGIAFLYLLVAPILLYLVFSLFDLFPHQEITTGRRPGVSFFFSHPQVLLASVVLFLVPILVYAYLGSKIMARKLSRVFLAVNMAAILGSLALVAPMPFVPKAEYHDYLTFLGVPTGFLAEAGQQSKGTLADRTGDTKGEVKRENVVEKWKAEADKTFEGFFRNNANWKDLPRLETVRYTSLPVDKFPNYKDVLAWVAMGGTEKTLHLVGGQQYDAYYTRFDFEKNSISGEPVQLPGTSESDFFIGNLGETGPSLSNSSLGVETFYALDARGPQEVSVGLRHKGHFSVAAVKNLEGFSARVREKSEIDKDTGIAVEDYVLDVLHSGGNLESYPLPAFRGQEIRSFHAEKRRDNSFYVTVVGHDSSAKSFMSFVCARSSGCQPFRSNGPDQALNFDNDVLKKGAHEVLRDTSVFFVKAMSFRHTGAEPGPGATFGTVTGTFRDRRFGHLVFFRNGSQWTYLTSGTGQGTSLGVGDVETLPNGAGFVLIVDERNSKKKSDQSWIVTLDRDGKARKVWRRPDERYLDLFVNKAGSIFVAGYRKDSAGNIDRPVVAELNAD